MIQEEKQILLQDICARLPYGVKVKYFDMEYPFGSEPVILTPHLLCNRWENIHDVKPYLRTMLSMTQEERREYCNECNKVLLMRYKAANHYPVIDWLISHYFDFRDLIKKGLALEAPEGMYKTE